MKIKSQNLHALLCVIFFRAPVAANETAPTDAGDIIIATQLPLEQDTAANAASPEGWIKLADYGDWPHPRGLQRFTKDSAEKMASNFASLVSRVKRVFGGAPVFVGHPDDPGFAGQPGHDDTRAYAWVNQLQARDDGLYVLPKWSAAGQEIMSNAFYKFVSPRWQLRPLGNNTFEPVRLISIGLTNHPNIPGEAIANQKTNPMNDVELKLLRTALGLPETADAAACIAAANTLKTTAANATTVSNELTNEKGKVTQLTSRAETAEGQANTNKTNFANERLARVSLLLDAAVADGRLTSATRKEWETVLANESTFAAKLAELAALKPAVSNQQLTKELGNRKPEIAAANERQAKLQGLVRTRMTSTGETYETAFSNVCKTEEGKAIVSQMQKPQSATDK